MNKTRFIWGISLLCLAGLIVILNFVFPPGNLTFTIAGQNMIWIPLLALCVVGCVLMITAARRAKGTAEPIQPKPGTNLEKAGQNKRLESIAWGLFLVMLGGFMFIPNDQVPGGFWSIGIGVIMLGLNAARYFSGIRMSGFTTFLGILSLLGGLAELIGLTSLQGALLLVILGAMLILKPWFDKEQLFGKAEVSRV